VFHIPSFLHVGQDEAFPFKLTFPAEVDQVSYRLASNPHVIE